MPVFREEKGTQGRGTAKAHARVSLCDFAQLFNLSNLRALKWELVLGQNMRFVKHTLKYLCAKFGNKRRSFD